jgi:hypothetical protein
LNSTGLDTYRKIRVLSQVRKEINFFSTIFRPALKNERLPAEVSNSDCEGRKLSFDSRGKRNVFIHRRIQISFWDSETYLPTGQHSHYAAGRTTTELGFDCIVGTEISLSTTAPILAEGYRGILLQARSGQGV